MYDVIETKERRRRRRKKNFFSLYISRNPKSQSIDKFSFSPFLYSPSVNVNCH